MKRTKKKRTKKRTVTRMSSVNLYHISLETQNLYDQLLDSIDEETGEVDIDIASALEVKKEEFTAAAISYATVIRMLNARKAEAEAEIERLTAIKGKLGQIADRMKNTLSMTCQGLGFEKINGLTATISFRKSEQTIIDNAEMIPSEFVKEKVTYTPDKTAIKNAIKAGQDVPGVHVETVNNIQIK